LIVAMTAIVGPKMRALPIARCRLKAKYNLSNEKMGEGILWEETSLEALLRLLGYLQAEIDERLNDPKLAKQLKLCVDRLRQVKRM
jgi:hypothetical protein